MVRDYEKKLDEEGLDIDDDEEGLGAGGPNGDVPMGTGKEEAAFADTGKVVDDEATISGRIGKAMEGLGLAGRGKEHHKRKRKGADGLVDV